MGENLSHKQLLYIKFKDKNQQQAPQVTSMFSNCYSLNQYCPTESAYWAKN